MTKLKSHLLRIVGAISTRTKWLLLGVICVFYGLWQSYESVASMLRRPDADLYVQRLPIALAIVAAVWLPAFAFATVGSRLKGRGHRIAGFLMSRGWIACWIVSFGLILTRPTWEAQGIDPLLIGGLITLGLGLPLGLGVLASLLMGWIPMKPTGKPTQN